MPLKCKYQFQVFGFHPVIEESVITDLLETGWKYMHQVTADEFGIFQGNYPAGPAGLFPSGRKSDLPFINRKDAAVCYCDLMCISAEIFNGIAKSIEGFFYVGAPVLVIKAIAEFRPFIRIPQLFTETGKSQSAAFVKRIETGKVFAFKFVPQDSYRNKEAAFCFPDVPVFGKPSSGNDAVHMHMVENFLIPCMEHLDDAGCRPEMLLISRKF